MKRPAFQFYPGDWLQDAGLRMCSAGARGLWIDMICLMHQGTPYGYLKVNHAPILPVNLARISGGTLPDVEGWILELETSGVFSRDDAGAIYSRRMIRDENIRAARAAGGILGGNPRLLGTPNRVGKVQDKVNLVANLKPTPSSSSSSSSSSESKDQDQEHAQPTVAPVIANPIALTEIGDTPKPAKREHPAERFEEFWAIYPVRKGKADALAKWKSRGYDKIADQIIADVRRRILQDRQWLAGFVPHGSTYVHGKGWEDDIEPNHQGTVKHSASDNFRGKEYAGTNADSLPAELR